VNLKLLNHSKNFEKTTEKIFKADLFTKNLLKKEGDSTKNIRSLKNKLPTIKTKEINSSILTTNGDLNSFYKLNVNVKNVLDFDKIVSKRFIC
jgi:hypothetical protein